jgi:hypothetical protein
MITPYTAYTHARDYRVRVRSRYSLDYLEGAFSELPLYGVLGSSDEIKKEHDRSEGRRPGDHPQQLPGGVVLAFLVWWRSPNPAAPVSHYLHPLAAPEGALDEDRIRKGASEGASLPIFILDGDHPIQGPHFPYREYLAGQQPTSL